jgi:hypothetical protein
MLNECYNTHPILLLDFFLTEIKSVEVIVGSGIFNNEPDNDVKYSISQFFYQIELKHYAFHSQTLS